MVITSSHHELLGLVRLPRLKAVAAVRATHHLRRHRRHRTSPGARHGDVPADPGWEIWKKPTVFSYGKPMKSLMFWLADDIFVQCYLAR